MGERRELGLGEFFIEDDVPAAYAAIANGLVMASAGPYRLACSGGASGSACMSALASTDLEWSRLEVYFVDERCVDSASPDANVMMISAALGARREDLGGFYPMSCSEGPEAYARTLRMAMPLQLLQLGFGPDGHVASLFPSSAALAAPSEELVVRNTDPLGNNHFERLTLTYSAISSSAVVVVTVMGAEKVPALTSVLQGADLPAAKVRGGRVIWLCERAVAQAIEPATWDSAAR